MNHQAWRSAVTISLVEQARGGPFVFWDSLPEGCRNASELGFDAVEIFASSPDAIDRGLLAGLLNDHDLQVAAFGTGAGWLIHQLQLLDDSLQRRQQAVDFIRRVIDLAGEFEAPAIIGSMQGRRAGDLGQREAWQQLADSLRGLGEHAAQYEVPLIYEPLNRYETNVCNTLADGVELLTSLAIPNVRLLADLFHMNIEEVDLAASIRDAGHWIGHVHFVDSNRRAAGMGHLDFLPIAAALQEIGYRGYLSAEALPLPDPLAAARQTVAAVHHLPTS